MNNDEYLRQKSFEGLAKKGLDDNPEYVDRLNEELDVISECGLSDFMLVTAYNVLLVKSHNILIGSGRGSAGGSLVSYCIGITEIDPLIYNLSFSRFVNKTRIKAGHAADIDCDSPRKDRQRVIKLLKDSWGDDKTTQIINDIYFTPKTILKDLGRIFGKDAQYMNKLTALMGDNQPYDVPEVVNFLEENPMIEKFFPKLYGLIRASGTHAGGILISDAPITDYMGTLKSTNNIVTAYNGKTCETLGLLKNDMLSLSTLDVIKDTLSFIGKNKFDFDYDLNDPNVYETINKSTLGIFQIESKEGSSYIEKMIPKEFNDIIACLALIRPGAKDSGDAEEFLKIRFGEKEVHYDHPLLEDILKETNGCILYQEQAMQISKVLSGFDDVEADNLRRGIGKKLDYIFTEYKPKFIKGAIKNNVPEDVAKKIWNKIEKGSSYSFNKSHSVGYSLITYQTAYLKTYYPIEYYTAMLNNVEDEDKRIRIYNEIKSLNKTINNPNINTSKDITIYDENNIYLSFNLVKGVGPAAIKDILANQPYESFDDFMERKTSKVNKSVVKALIEAGAFDCFDTERDKLYSIIDEQEHHWDEKERLYREFDRIRINPSSNALDLYKLDEIGINLSTVSIKQLKENKDDYNDFYIKVMPSEFKKKEDYAFCGVTDGFDSLSIYVSKEFLSRYIDELKSIGTPLLCHVSAKGEKCSLLSLINLQEPEKYERELWLYNGVGLQKTQQLQVANQEVYIGLVSNVSYFTSKNGNPCSRYNVTLGDGTVLEGRIRVNPERMYEGSFIAFTVGDNEVFLNIMQVI